MRACHMTGSATVAHAGPHSYIQLVSCRQYTNIYIFLYRSAGREASRNVGRV